MTWEPDACVLRRLTADRARRCLVDVGPVFFIGDSVSRYQFLALLHFLAAGKYQHPYDTDRSLTNAHKHDGDSVTQYTNLWKHAKAQVRRHAPEGSSLSYRLKRQDDLEQAHLSLSVPGSNKTADVLYHFTKGASAIEYEEFYAWVSKHVNKLAGGRAVASPKPSPATTSLPSDSAAPAPAGPATSTASALDAGVVGNATVTPKPAEERQDGASRLGGASLEGRALAEEGGGVGPVPMGARIGRRVRVEGEAAGESMVGQSDLVSKAGATGGGADSASGASTWHPPGPIQATPPSAPPASSVAAPQPPATPTLGAAARPPLPAAQSPPASHPTRALVVLNVCAHYGSSPALAPDVKSALAAARNKLPPGTQVVWRSCTTPLPRYRRVLDAAEAEIAAFAAGIGVPVLDLRGVAMAAVRQGLVTTWNRDTVHFHQWVYGEFNDVLFNVLCPPEP
ncbi:hypothetical protein HYH03_001422 [Edaphochlamys debaryana]|uniref:Uncharacterized protein n=1 Tax=Edaphochlamys debaryana TaxID=47281 RepID=A0A835YDL9_9CHLO|nr:hypothetical protein HYH03_001422 [Edaphochlamys debaryana]|eukprot:KAG2500656.1 hypothetical protein HYH03_001422 [Edaphochlamys debaryana]